MRMHVLPGNPEAARDRRIDSIVSTADRITAALAEVGLSRADAARRIGVTRQTVSRWATGAVEPSLESLRRLADALNIPRTRLLPKSGQIFPTITVEQDGEDPVRIVVRRRTTITVTPG